MLRSRQLKQLCAKQPRLHKFEGIWVLSWLRPGFRKFGAFPMDLDESSSERGHPLGKALVSHLVSELRYAGWYAIIAFAKLLAISITVSSGFRGGFIFPLFLVGTSLGQMVAGLGIPFISALPPVLLSMCFASGRTPNLQIHTKLTPILCLKKLFPYSATPQCIV